MFKKILILTALCLVPAAHGEESDHAIHEELRGLLKVTREAVNSGRYEDMLPALSENIRLTTIIQAFVGNRKEVPAYFAAYFGPGKKLKSMKMDWEPETLTELSPDKSWGLAYGKGTEDYVLNDGRSYHLPTRWTSVVTKEADGKWRIRSMHIGTNFMENELLDEIAGKAKSYAIASGVGGIVVGLFLGYLLGRRGRSKS